MFVIRKPMQESKTIIRTATAQELINYEKNKAKNSVANNKK